MLLYKKKNLTFRLKLLTKIFLIQSPMILGFLLPYIFYSDFFYTETRIDDFYVNQAFKFFLINIIVINIFIIVTLFFVKEKEYTLKHNFTHLFGSISLIASLISRFFDLYYYLDLFFYISQFLILLNILIISHHKNQKKNIFINCIYIFLCCLLSLYTGDSKYTLVSLIVILIITIDYLNFKQYLFLILIFTIISSTVLGFKKIYRDIIFSGGMDKLNYSYNDENTTYTENQINKPKIKLNYNYFLNEKIDYLKFDKSYFFSNYCGVFNYNDYKNNAITYLDDYLSKYQYDNIKKNNLIELNIEKKVNSFCYTFFRAVGRIDLLTQLSQANYLVKTSSKKNGDSYKPILFIPIPRFLLKNKPTDNADEIWMSFIPAIKNPLDKNRTIISVNPFSEAFMNFMNNGKYITIFIYVIIFLLYLSASRSNNILLITTSYSLIINIINTNLSAKQIFGSSYQILVIYLLIYFTSYLLKKLVYFKNFF